MSHATARAALMSPKSKQTAKLFGLEDAQHLRSLARHNAQSIIRYIMCGIFFVRQGNLNLITHRVRMVCVLWLLCHDSHALCQTPNATATLGEFGAQFGHIIAFIQSICTTSIFSWAVVAQMPEPRKKSRVRVLCPTSMTTIVQFRLLSATATQQAPTTTRCSKTKASTSTCTPCSRACDFSASAHIVARVRDCDSMKICRTLRPCVQMCVVLSSS